VVAAKRNNHSFFPLCKIKIEGIWAAGIQTAVLSGAQLKWFDKRCAMVYNTLEKVMGAKNGGKRI
jgi:hypothetical protein